MVCKSRAGLDAPAARLVAAAALFLLSVTVWAQVETELTPQAVAVGESVTLRIVVDHEEPSDVSIDPVVPAGFRISGGPTIRPINVAVSNERTRAVEITFQLIATTAGRFVVAPIPLEVAGQRYETEPKLVEIGEATERSRVPFQCRWVAVNEELVAGQSTVVSLEMYNVREYTYPTSVSVTVPTNAIFEEIQGVGTIAQKSVDGIELLAIPVAAFMLTPPGPGSVTIPKAIVEADGMSVVADETNLSVAPAPEAIESSGAVGTFVLESETDKESLSIGETVTFRLRVSGTGNLHFLRFPDIEVSGFDVEMDRIDDAFEPVESGYTGYRERTLRLRPSRDGVAQISVDPLVFFEPDRGRIRRLTVDVPGITVTSVKMPQPQEEDSLPFVLLDAAQIGALRRSTAYQNPLSYGWLLPGLLLLVARLLWKRQGTTLLLLVCMSGFVLIAATSDPMSQVDEMVELAAHHYENEEIPEAIAIMEDVSRQFPHLSGVHYNLAVLYFQVGELPRSAYAAREAIRMNPRERLYRQGLAIIEESGGIEHSIRPKQFVHPGIFFGSLTIATNLLCVVLAFAWRRQRGGVVLAEVVLVLAVIASATMLVVSARTASAPTGVILSEITLLRIPDDNAAGWREVAAATAVDIVATQSGHVLVRTGIGHEGWADIGEVLWHENPEEGTLRYLSSQL